MEQEPGSEIDDSTARVDSSQNSSITRFILYSLGGICLLASGIMIPQLAIIVLLLCIFVWIVRAATPKAALSKPTDRQFANEFDEQQIATKAHSAPSGLTGAVLLAILVLSVGLSINPAAVLVVGLPILAAVVIIRSSTPSENPISAATDESE